MNRSLRRFAIATWAAAAGLVAIFALFWRIAYVPPHALWAIVTTGAVLIFGALTVCTGLWQLVRGPRRTLAAATGLLGTTPIIWFAMYVLTFLLQGRDRAPRQTAATRIVGFWAASIGDVEARWRYPRWTHGQHVILIDNGQTPEPTKLVAQMDEHIEQMAARLHAQLPTEKARWVRGSLLWQHGNAILCWAVCDADQNSPELQRLDRHEMAHVIIMSMGSVDQNPPALLVEGWAETQSKDRADLIVTLDDKTKQGPTFTSSLQELIDPEWYDRPMGHMYDHGGPLAVYLMEHYGAEKFLKLYHGVRFATFAADCERILGDPWPVVEQNFWKWLASEAAKLKGQHDEPKPPAGITDKDVILAKSVNRHDWQTIVDGYRAARSKRPPMPKTCAFKVDHNWTAPPNNSDDLPPRHEESTECVVDGESVWQVRTYQPKGSVDCVVFTPALHASVELSAEGRVTRSKPSTQRDVTSALEYADVFASFGDLGHFLPINPQRHYDELTTRIEAIRPPGAPNQSIWEIDYVERYPDDKIETARHLQIDAAADWLVAGGQDPSGNERNGTHYTLATIFGRKATAEQKTRSTDKEGEWTVHNRIRELTPAEAQAVREKAEEIARRRPARDWYATLIQPLTLAVAWPATGLFLLGLALFRSARRDG